MALSRDGAALRLKDDDHVAVCLRDVPAGAEVAFAGSPAVNAQTAIPASHKIALRAVAAGELICKYGQTIGRASAAIAPGEHVHVHNVEGTRGRGDLAPDTADATAGKAAMR
jgi:altronate dehydratase